MIDLNRAKKRLEELQTQGNRKDWSKLSYSLAEGTNTLRFVLPPGEDWPFIYGRMHYNLQKRFFCTLQGDQDPIIDELNKISKSGNPEDAEFAKKNYPSRRVFALVLVREQEENGLVWVNFPQKIEKEIMNYMFNGEYIEMQVDKLQDTNPGYKGEVLDITHPIYGVDFVITKKKGSGFPEYSVAPKKLTNPFSKLAETPEKIKELFNNTPGFDEAYKRYSPSEMMEIWEKFLSGDSDGVSDELQEIQEEEKIDISSALAKFKQNRRK